MSAAYDLIMHLVSEGFSTFGGSDDWSMHLAREPVSPDNVITLYDTGGPAPVNYSINLRQPTIQVRVRCHDYLMGLEKHEDIYLILNAISTQNIGDWMVLGVHLTTDFLSVGRDSNDRHLITANYQIQRGQNRAKRRASTIFDYAMNREWPTAN